jgi:hypothetical protein
MTTLDPAVRDLLAAVRGALYTPYTEGPSTPDAVILARAALASVLVDGVPVELVADLLARDTAEAADSGRVRHADQAAAGR